MIKHLFLLTLIAWVPSCALLEGSGTGRTITDPVTGEVREETKADVLVGTATAAGSVISPATTPLLAVAGMAAAGLIGVLVKKKTPA